MSKPRILLVGPWPPTKGGVTTFMQNLAGDQDLQGDYAFIPHTTSRPAKQDTTENWGYRALFAGGLARAFTAVWISLWHFLIFPWRVIAGRISLVQVMASDFFVFWESIAYVLAAKAMGRPTVLRLGGAFDKFWEASGPRARKLITWSLQRPDRIIVQSDYWLSVVATAGRSHGLVVVNNWIDDGLLGMAMRPPATAPRILFIAGNEATRKGVDCLLAALDQLVAGNITFHLTVIATPRPLAERLQALPWALHVRTLGFIERTSVLAELDQADVFVLPSRGEGFPNSLVEAMARGCAAIATPVGAVPEVIEPGLSGLITAVDDASALAAALERVCTDGGFARSLGAAAVERIRSRFTARALRPVWRGLYGSLLGR